MIKILFLSLFLPSFFISVIMAQDTGKTISLIEIVGLKKTNPEVVRNAIDIKEGDDISSFDKTKLRQSLNKLDLFSKIDISSVDSNDGVKIQISVREKLTRLIIPLAKSGTNGTAVGAALLDSNFLGQGDTLVLVAVYGETSNLYSIIFNNKKLFETNFTSVTQISYDSSSYMNQSILNKDMNKYEYSQKLFKGSYAFGYNFETTALLLNGSYKSFEITGTTDTHDKKLETYSFGPVIHIDKITYSDFLPYGFDLKATLFKNITNLEEDDTNLKDKIYSNEFNLQASYSFKISPNNKVALAFDTTLSDLPFFEQNRTSNERGMRSLVDENISYQNVLAGTISNEYLFYYNNTFGFSNILFAETGKINGEFDKSYIQYTGVGTGLNVYFRKVALPAMGLYVTNNFRTNATQVIFVVGISL